ncbi:MFS transporter [Demequina sp. NBRC 110054]|uniref:MFS transporter n=1 Tax=Demequina sp. NBRC 110054 TaxID=1570343 RepID=UPI000A052AC4|nr:MFS transporter [Demequina sp. NBRC 110054]
MSKTGSPSQLAGKSLALAGVVLVALTLRTSIASLSPIVDAIRADLELDVATLATLGVLPPACFALFGMAGSRLAARLGLEATLVVAMAVTIVGHLVRALAPTIAVLIVGTLLGLAGMAIGNVLLPPIVKRYFPDRAGAITSLYATLIAVSTAVPPLVAAPVADAAGWRVSLGSWALLSAIAATPWLALVRSGRNVNEDIEPDKAAIKRLQNAMWRSPLAWSLGVIFSVSAMNGYAMFAWLPTLLTETADLNATQAGALLSLYAALGIPLALLMPMLTERTDGAAWLLSLGMLATIVGNAGLALAPSAAPALWVAIAGLGPMLFPACLTMFHLRSRTEHGAAALSGFSQSVGYVLGLAGPLVVGVLYEHTGTWTAPLVFLSAVALPGLAATLIAARPTRIENETMRQYAGQTSA